MLMMYFSFFFVLSLSSMQVQAYMSLAEKVLGRLGAVRDEPSR